MSAIMTLPTDSLGALNVFVQAAETRSFTAAGRQLGISSSAVGKAVARLEERLGVRLFHRSTRAITLTPEGSLFLERCRRIFCEVEAAELELSRTRAHPRGVLRVSLPVVGMLMMPTLSAFMHAWPDIELDLDFSDRLVDVIEEGFDAVIRTGEASDSRLMTRVLGTFGYRLVGAPAYFEKTGRPRHLATLPRTGACFIAIRRRASWRIGISSTTTGSRSPPRQGPPSRAQSNLLSTSPSVAAGWPACRSSPYRTG